MITRKLIDLPNHPILTNITRKAQVDYTRDDSTLNEFLLYFNVYHYDETGKILNYFPKEVRLRASNEDYVNSSTGEKVSKILNENNEEVWPEGSIGQYDYFYKLVNIFKALTQKELEEVYIIKRIEKINEQLYK